MAVLLLLTNRASYLIWNSFVVIVVYYAVVDNIWVFCFGQNPCTDIVHYLSGVKQARSTRFYQPCKYLYRILTILHVEVAAGNRLRLTFWESLPQVIVNYPNLTNLPCFVDVFCRFYLEKKARLVIKLVPRC